jgi:hypothetical protein
MTFSFIEFLLLFQELPLLISLLPYFVSKDIQTEPNKIIHMAGDFQKEFTHEIPMEKKKKNPRVSFTIIYLKQQNHIGALYSGV